MVNSPENIKDNDLLINAIKCHQSDGKIKVSMEKFFAAFGIKNAGNEAGRILEKEIGDWQKIKTSSIDELEAFDGIGPIMAQEIVSFFQKNKEKVEDVEQYFRFGVKMNTGKLEGKSFCLSGKLEGGKASWKKLIENKGGVVKNSVGRSISFVVAGQGSGLKTKKAEELGIPVLTTDDLEKLLSS